MKRKPLVSVIVTTKNEEKNVEECLRSVKNQTFREIELILVDNYSRDRTIEIAKKYADKVYLRGPERSSQRNLGAEISEGKYLLFLDSHVIPSPGSFRRLIEYHDGWKGVAHCAVNYWLEFEHKTLYGYRWQPEKFWGTWTRTKPKPPDYKVIMSGTSSSLIDRDVFFEIGKFNEHLGIYGGGEPYIDLKVQMFGYDVRMPPNCRLWHLTEPRGYNWNNKDLHRNFMIAAFALGGEEFLEPVYQNYLRGCKGVER